MAILKQSTLYTRAFLMVTTSDHITGFTSGTSTMTVNLSKAGGGFTTTTGVLTALASGWYTIGLTSSDVSTLGDLAYHITATGADPTDFVDQVATQIFGDNLFANVVQWLTSSVTVNAASIPRVDVVDWNGSAVPAPNFPGVPKTDADYFMGVTGSTTSVMIGVNVVSVAGAASNIKKNQALNNFEFIMTDSTTNAPKTGLTVTATRSLDGGAFGACANAVSEISSGWYSINLAATDTNANVIGLRFNAAGANDQDITIITQP